MGAFSLRNFLEEGIADLNPFDGGKTGATVRTNRPKPRPAQTPKANTTQRQPMNQQQSAQVSAAMGLPEQPKRIQINMPKPMTMSSVMQPKAPVVDIAKPAPVTSATVVAAAQNRPKPAAKPAPLPDQQFLETSAGAPQPKKLFGMDVSKPLGKFGTTQTVSANKTMSTNKDKYVAGFDRLHGDVKKILVNQAKEKAAKGDIAAQNTLRALKDSGRMEGDGMDFIEGSNERYLGGMARAALRTGDFVVPGKNTFGMEEMADNMDSRRNGMSQYTDSGKAGEFTGQAQKFAADVVGMVVPGVAAEKAIRGTKAIQGMTQGSKLARFGAYTATNAGGGIPATAIEMAQSIGRGQEVDAVKSGSIGLAADMGVPMAIRGGSRLVKFGMDKFKPAAEQVVDPAVKAIDDVMQPAPAVSQAPELPAAIPQRQAAIPARDTPTLEQFQQQREIPSHVLDYAHSTRSADDLVNETADYWVKHGKETKGGQLINTEQADDAYGAGGGYKRISEHNQFYKDFYKQYKKPPTRADYNNEVRRQLEDGGGSMVDPEQAAAYRLVKDREVEERAVAGTRVDTTDFDDFLSRNGMDKMPPAAAKPPVAPKEKLSKFANETVQGSDEMSTPLKKLVKDEQVTYDAVTNAGRAENAKSAIDGVDDGTAFARVINDLRRGKADGGQKEFNAIELAKRLDSRTDEESLTMATEILHELSAKATKKGQEIQALAYLNNRTPQGLKFGALRDLDNAKIKITPEIKAQVDALTENIAKHPMGSDARNFAVHELAGFVTKQIPVGMAPKIINFWRAGLLTAPTTTAGNLLGNTGEAVVRKGFVDPIAEVADYLMSKKTGKRTFAQNGGFAAGAKEGAGKLERFMKTGYDERNALSKYDSKELNYGDGAVGSKVGKYVNGTYRLMSVADQPFWYGARNEALAGLAKVDALNKGLKGAEADKFMNDFLDNPPAAAMEQATKDAKYGTFQNETMLGSVASFIKKGAEKGAEITGGNPDTGRAIADFFIPFTQVPASIATRVVQRTPVGTGLEIAKQIINTRNGKPFDQRAMAKAIGEGSFGSAVFGGGYALANSGLLTFGFPEDSKERELWEAEGKQPYSLKVGDRWYSLNYLQPFGTLLAIGGESANAVKEGADATETISRGIATAGQAVMNQSFLKGVSGVLDAIDDPKRYAENYVENTASGVVPNFIRAFARAQDPLQRDAKGVAEGIQGAIPGLRQNLPAKTDMFGEDVTAKDNFANQYVNPLRPSKVKGDEVTAELRRLQDAGLGIIPTSAKKDAFTGHTLTREQVSEINKRAGKAMKAEYKELVASDDYKSMSDAQKADSIKKINDTVYGAVKTAYGSELGISELASLDKKQKRYLSGSNVDFLSKKKSDGSSADGMDVHDSLDRELRSTLADYDVMTTEEREQKFRGEKDAEYKYELAKAKNDELLGKLTKAEAVKTRTKLQKAKVGADYDKETREMYGLSKGDLWDLVNSDPEGQKYVDSIVAYGDALEEAGLGYNKFRNKNGEIAIEPTSRASSGGGGRGGKGSRGGSKASKKYDLEAYLNPVATGKSLRAILAEAKVGKSSKA